jgi:hypothetical protein
MTAQKAVARHKDWIPEQDRGLTVYFADRMGSSSRKAVSMTTRPHIRRPISHSQREDALEDAREVRENLTDAIEQERRP